MNPNRIYQALLHLYPNDYRTLFAMEMLHSFEQATAEHRGQSMAAFSHFLFIEFVSLLIGAGAEWVAKLTTDNSVRGRTMPDLRMMRPPGVPRELWFAGARLSAHQSSLSNNLPDFETDQCS